MNLENKFPVIHIAVISYYIMGLQNIRKKIVFRDQLV